MKAHVAVSRVADGSMKGPDAVANRETFLSNNSMGPRSTTLVHLVYEGDDYCRYHTVTDKDAGAGIVRESQLVADALFTRSSQLALFLPLADCAGVVLVDERQNILGLSHMGRHNLQQQGARRSIEYMVHEFGTKPEDITAYISPAAGSDAYPLFDFDGRSIGDVTREQLMCTGVLASHIEVAPDDTTKDETYFSHSEFLKGHRSTDGRHGIVARLAP